MGLTYQGTQFMIWLRNRGVDFSTTATIGRQGMHLTKKELKRNFDYFGENVEDTVVDSMFAESPTFAEGFLNYLGAREVHSFDYSAYEGATVLHDMNRPISDQHKKKYTLVIDGGSLEHIFNFPTAMKNCMEMVKVGGHLATMAPCNNYVGHGFYQFSPELYFRVLSPANGFKVEAALLAEDRRNAMWWLVRDPEEVRCRVTVMTHFPTILYVLARKVQEIIPFENHPQQSDYFALWTGQELAKEGTILSMRQRLARRWLGSSRHLLLAIMPPFVRDTLASRFNHRFFEAVDLSRKA